MAIGAYFVFTENLDPLKAPLFEAMKKYPADKPNHAITLAWDSFQTEVSPLDAQMHARPFSTHLCQLSV